MREARDEVRRRPTTEVAPLSRHATGLSVGPAARPAGLSYSALGRVVSVGLAIQACNSAARACLGASSRKVL